MNIFDTKEEAQAYCDAFMARWSYVYFPTAHVFDNGDGRFRAICDRATSTGD
jgi:hypothetical protein